MVYFFPKIVLVLRQPLSQQDEACRKGGGRCSQEMDFPESYFLQQAPIKQMEEGQ